MSGKAGARRALAGTGNAWMPHVRIVTSAGWGEPTIGGTSRSDNGDTIADPFCFVKFWTDNLVGNFVARYGHRRVGEGPERTSDPGLALPAAG
jgi:hypothetical protein